MFRTHRSRWSRWLKKSLPKTRSTRRLSFDVLEDRRLLTAGSLDPTFGTGGEVSTTFPYTQPSSDSGTLVVVQPDGKYIVGGSTSSGLTGLGISSDFLLTRYNSDGTLDTSFGNNGEAIANFGLSASNPAPIITGLTLTSSGQIVAVGDVSLLYMDVLVTRFNSNGSLDTSFGGTGMVLSPIDGTTSVGGVAVQSDGRTVVSATMSGGSSNAISEFALLRYNSDGSLDSSFGTRGIVTAELNSEPASASAVALQSDGKIIVGGDVGVTYQSGAASSSPQEFALARFNANGSIDLAFGDGGEVTTAIEYGAEINSLAIQPDGKIIAGGSALATNPAGGTAIMTYDDFALARYNTDGTLDASFGNEGIVTTDFDSRNDKLQNLAIQANGQIVAVGSSLTSGDQANLSVFNLVGQPFSTTSSPDSAIAVARYNADGSLDTGFGSGGIVLTDTASGDTSGNAVALLANGDTLVVGVDGSARTATSLALVEYTSTGSLDSAFANGGIELLHLSITLATNAPASAEQTIVQPDGKILVLGVAQKVGGVNVAAVARYNPDGSLDTGFGTGGSELLPQFGPFYNSMAFMPDGQIVIVGENLVTRLNADGSVDQSFGDQGFQSFLTGGAADEETAFVVQPDGKIVIVATQTPAIYAVPATGGGTISGAVGAALETDVLVRLNTDGRLDASFGNGGVETIPGASLLLTTNAIALQNDGKIVIANSELQRFNSDGSVDTAFGNHGSVALPNTPNKGQSQLLIQPDGQILFSGGYYDQLARDFELVRYNSDGSLDTTFNGGSPVVGSFGASDSNGLAAMALETSGKIVIVGNTTDPEFRSTATIFQYNSDGSLDTTFGNQGQTQISTAINGLTTDSSGKIIAVGGQSIDFEVFRFEDSPPNSSGTPITLPITPPINSPFISPQQSVGIITPPTSGGNPISIPSPFELPFNFRIIANPGPVNPPDPQPYSPATSPVSLTLLAAGNDQLIVQFTDANDFSVTLDGQTTIYSTSQYNAVNFTGATGSSAVVAGALGSAGVAFTANSAVISGAAITINISATGTIYVYGNSAETAQLNGGTGGNTLAVAPGYSEMYGSGFADFAVGFGQAYGYSSGSQDTAYFYAGSGDKFVSTPTYSYLSSSGGFGSADGFASVLAAAAADGSGQAWLYGATTGTNSFVANNQYSYMSGAGFFNEVTGFNSVMGVSGGASDYAYLTDMAGSASFSGYSSYSFLAGANFNYQAMGFANVVGTGTTSDQAEVYDSNSGDTIQQSTDRSQVTLNKSTGTTLLNSFGEVAGHVATAGDPNHEVDYFYNSLGA